MTISLGNVHLNAKKPSAYVVVIENTGSEGHPLPPVGGAPVVQAWWALLLRVEHRCAQSCYRKQSTVRCDTHAGQV